MEDCNNQDCGSQGGQWKQGCLNRRDVENCNKYIPLKSKTDGGATVPCGGGLDAQLAKTTITMFITFMQASGAWPCILETGEAPKVIPAREVFKMKNEFVAKMCN